MNRSAEPLILHLDDPSVEVRLRVSARARRFTLRLDRGGGAVLTLPPGVPRAEARMFLMRQADWLARALARRPEPVRLGPGIQLPVEGRMVEIRCPPGPRRAPQLDADALILPGANGASAGPRVAAYLKLRARDRLVPAAQRYADRIGKDVTAVSLRDTVSRWGSCSAAGRLSFSWRLAMAPADVLDYVAAHEVAHLAEMNHGSRFWDLVERLVPDYRARRAWLRTEGRALHRYRFDAG